MNTKLKSAMALAVLALATQASAQFTIYENDDYQGRNFSTSKQVANLANHGFNDRASSVVVTGKRWEACQDANYQGRCVVLRPGQYPSLGSMGLNDKLSSMRAVSSNASIEEDRYAPAPLVTQDYRRRKNERLYQADVSSVRAVLGAAEQRCWTEKEQVPNTRGEANVPAAIAGAVIGGILGHQVGGGTGQTIATVGGAVGGAALGSNIGRDGSGQRTTTRDVQRCADVPGTARTEYWDVTYNFRGQEHHMQMTQPPGATVTVNDKGEPRV